MVLPKIAQGIISVATKYGVGIAKSEGLILNKAWKGFKHKSSIVAGIRTGLLGGAVIGSVITGTTPTTDYAEVPFTGSKSSSYKFRKGNRRFNSTRRRRHYKNNCNPRNCC